MTAPSFTDPAVQRCPYHVLDRLREEQPVYRDPVTGFYVLTRYDDMVHVNQHPELFSNTTTVILDRKHSPVAQEVACRYQDKGFLPMHTLVTNDPPSHTQYRSLVDRVFSAPFVKQLEGRITELADQLIDSFADRKQVDLMTEFAIKLPMYMISEQLGVSKEDWRRFKHWSDISLEQINPVLDPQRELAITDELIHMQQYLWARGEHYMKTPADTLLSRLVNTELEGRRLNAREYIAIAHQLLVAGNETTTSGIASGVLMLLQNPAVLQRLLAEPALVPNFVEEVLRLHAPSPNQYRQVKETCAINGVTLPKDSVVMVNYLSANRDPAKFDHPEQIDLDRANGRQHMAFGRGIHFCIGNQLARAEMRIAFERLLARLPQMKLDPAWPEPGYAPLYHVHALDQLHVVF
ncbi:MAG TPA: cytochrome P450 [Macromonas sp.]|nr:cytochrome P450 [Macromonas sp.]